MKEGVTAKRLYRTIARTVGPVVESAGFSRAPRSANTWMRTQGDTWLFIRTLVSRTQGFNPIIGGRFFFRTWRGSTPDEPAVPFQNAFELNHFLNEAQLEKKKQLRNRVLRKVIEQKLPAQSFQLALDVSRQSLLEAQLQMPERGNQEAGMPYLDLTDVEMWAAFLCDVFPTLHSELLRRRRNLADIAGSLLPDPEFDAIMAEQDRIDPEMWE
jgi:hypothetical protein